MEQTGVLWLWYLRWEPRSGALSTRQSINGEQIKLPPVVMLIWRKMCYAMASNAMHRVSGQWPSAFGVAVDFCCGLGKEKVVGVRGALLFEIVDNEYVPPYYLLLLPKWIHLSNLSE